MYVLPDNNGHGEREIQSAWSAGASEHAPDISGSSFDYTQGWRFGKTTYSLALHQGWIRATDLRRIKTSADDFGVISGDPAFEKTAFCESTTTFIDGIGGSKGILLYRAGVSGTEGIYARDSKASEPDSAARICETTACPKSRRASAV